MKNSDALNQNSPNEVLRNYFKKIFELQKSGESFPADLDEVWTIVYTKRRNAIRELTEKFLQDIDYQVSLKNEQNPQGGRPTKKFQLSVACLEYFIARKVRPVFEIYRRATHEYKARLETGYCPNLNPDNPLDLLELGLKAARHQQKQIQALDTRLLDIETRTQARLENFTVAAFAKLKGKHIGLKRAAQIGRKATALCKKRNIEVEKIWDTRYGEVNVYPKAILEEVFEEIF